MIVDRPDWLDYPVGILTAGPIKDVLPVTFQRREWDLGGERFIGKSFPDLATTLLRESRFNVGMFTPEKWVGNDHGGIIQVVFKIYQVNPHEQPSQLRATGSGGEDYWVPVEIDYGGRFIGYNPLADTSLATSGYAVSLVSRVVLDNRTCPGSFGGYAHFPMLDITKPPTEENVAHVVKEIPRRCGIDKFFVLRSSGHGMMMISPELVDDDNFLAILLDSLQMNHVEVDSRDHWVDERWISRSTQNLCRVAGRLNPFRVGGILRLASVPGVKHEIPEVIAASF